MPKEILVQYLSEKEQDEVLRLRILMQSAPAIKGLKESCMLMIPVEKVDRVLREMKATGMEHRILHRGDRKYVVLFYWKERLATYIKRKDVRTLLAKYGYTDFTLEASLSLLCERVGYFYGEEQTFPHEIGAFLGYPVSDIEGFIKNSGKNFLLSKYWKVYSEFQKTRALFEQYDEAKNQAIRELMDGKNLAQIAGAA